MNFFDSIRDVNSLSVLVRLLLAVLCGGIIGLERERKHRPAGFRTHILICLGAAVTTLTSQYLFLERRQFTDIARLGAQVIAGIGFIGAGTIIVTQHRRVKGLTTAAGLWANAAIGLCLGAGFYEGAIAATVIVLTVELLFSKLEYRIMDNAREVNILVEYESIASLNQALKYMKEVDLRIISMEIIKAEGNPNGKNCVNINLLIHRKLRIKDMIADISHISGIETVERL